MQLFHASRSPDTRSSSSGQDSGDYARLITDNLAFMEKQCRRAVLKTMTFGAGAVGDLVAGSPGEDGLDLENQTDELLNEVLDRLRGDDFKALREFRGKAKLTTYLTTIVANLIIDLVRQKKGRSRARERAKEMGEVAERLYDLVYARGYSLHQAHSHLEITHGMREPLESLQEMLDRMRGRGERSQMLPAADPEAAWLVPGRKMLVDEVVEVVVTDPRKNAEAALIDDQKQTRAQQAVAGLVGELSGEDRLMLRMRFPADDAEPKSCKEIGKLLGVSENGIDAKIRRILVRFREILLRQGLTLHDFTN